MNKGVVIATCMVDQTNLKFPAPLATNNLSQYYDGSLRDNSPLLPSSSSISTTTTTTTTTSIPFPSNKSNNMDPLVQDFSPPNSNLLEPRSLNSSLRARGPTKPPRRTNQEFGCNEQLPSDGTVRKLEETSSSSPSNSTESLRQDVMNRAANLRTLLRSAKIPQIDFNDSLCSGRRPSISVDIWQAAMISTPRDRLRHGEFPNWLVYGSSDSPFYQHLSGLSASNSSLSGKETLLSSSLNSSHENSLGGGSRSCSPPSSEKQYSNSRSELSPPSTANNARYLLRSPSDSQQEVLKTSSIPKAPRTSPSNVSLIARITNLHQTATKSHKNNLRRPNTATGTTEPTPISKALSGSPKPGSSYGRSTPCPKTATGVSGGLMMMSSLSLTGTKVASPSEPRSTKLQMYKRPATANCAGSTSASTSSFGNDLLIGRPFPITKLSPPKSNTGYVPSLPPIQGRVASDKPASDQPKGSPSTMSYTRLQQESHLQDQTTSIEQVAPGHTSPAPPSIALPYDSAPELIQSVSNTGFIIPHSPSTSKRNAFYSAAPLSITSDRLTDMDAQRAAPPPDSLRAPPEDFHSKSRYLTVSVSPPPSSATIAPGQRISVHVKLSNKAKLRKYTSIFLVLVGSTASESDSHTLGSHDFLRHNVMIHPSPADEVCAMSPSGDPSEWHVELTIPAYANCPCSPGPLPVPSTGTHTTGNVSYSLQLHADRKQLLSTQESLSIKLHVATPGEARYQVTTQMFKTQGRKGRIPFAGGYLGAVDELTLSHQMYYQSADRLRVGYQFELRLSSNSFLPPALAEDVSKATKLQVHQLMKEQSQQPGLKFTDHRSKVVVIPSDDRGHPAKWIVKGFLELKAVSQQMKIIKPVLESTARRAETSAGGRSILSSSHGSLSPPTQVIPTGLQQETERQARLNSSQLFLTASIDHFPAVFTAPIELSSSIGPELLSPCPLRLLGDEMMKRAIMAEKMMKVQEENSKNFK